MFSAPGTPGITAYRHPSKSGELLVPPSISGKYHLFYMIEKRFLKTGSRFHHKSQTFIFRLLFSILSFSIFISYRQN